MKGRQAAVGHPSTIPPECVGVRHLSVRPRSGEHAVMKLVMNNQLCHRNRRFGWIFGTGNVKLAARPATSGYKAHCYSVTTRGTSRLMLFERHMNMSNATDTVVAPAPASWPPMRHTHTHTHTHTRTHRRLGTTAGEIRDAHLHIDCTHAESTAGSSNDTGTTWTRCRADSTLHLTHHATPGIQRRQEDHKSSIQGTQSAVALALARVGISAALASGGRGGLRIVLLSAVRN